MLKYDFKTKLECNLCLNRKLKWVESLSLVNFLKFLSNMNTCKNKRNLMNKNAFSFTLIIRYQKNVEEKF